MSNSEIVPVTVEDMMGRHAFRKKEGWFSDVDGMAGIIYEAVTSGARLKMLRPPERFKVTGEFGNMSRDLIDHAINVAFSDYNEAFYSLNPDYEPEESESVVN